MRSRFPQPPRLILALLAGFGAALPAAALPAIRQETLVALTVDAVLVAPPAEGQTVGTRSATLDPVKPTELALSFDWPGGTGTSTLTLSGTGRVAPDGDEHLVTLGSALKLPDGRVVRADWSVRIREGSTRLVEAYADRGVRVLLALKAESVTRPVVAGAARVAPPQVRFRLEIQHVLGESSESLETNVLDTFLGESVEYSFERGQDDDLENLRVSLRPVRLDGDVAEVDVEVTGTLPGSPNRVVISRREKLLTTRGSASALTVASGDPPAGYRFQIRPEW